METNSAEVTDSVLLQHAADGDLGAIRELYDRHAPWLTARLLRRCNDREVVLDVVQDTFLVMWQDARKWRNDGDVAGWLWGIAFRRMVSRLRQRKQHVLLPGWDTATTVTGGVLPAAEDVLLLDIEYGDLGTALRRLSPEFRAVVQACVLDGLTTREASHLLGIRVNTVKTRLHRAKAQLRGSLADVRLEGWQ